METDTPLRERPTWPAIRRGLAGRCPACGVGRIFGSYLKVADSCTACGEALHHHRADDAPPYFTMVIVGHIVVPGILILEKLASPRGWVQLAIWMPLSLALILVLLPVVKGAIVAWQWALRMHGFSDPDRDRPVDDGYKPNEEPSTVRQKHG